MPSEYYQQNEKRVGNLTYIFSLTSRYSFPPIAAFMGGVVSQEIVKAITQKFTPICQNFYYDCVELFPVDNVLDLGQDARDELLQDVNAYNDRYLGIK